MSIFAFICKDGGDKTALRSKLLIDHLRHIESVADKVAVGGPCPPTGPGDKRQFEGSLILMHAQNAAEARTLFERDPYYKAGIWDSIEMMNFLPVVGEYIGGQTWTIEDGKMKPAEPHRKAK
ncbi:MAG: YciI family protein [Alphaproteobacteria bacterium]|nr:YciI family protein [Alphaproteobacteria bacterium]